MSKEQTVEERRKNFLENLEKTFKHNGIWSDQRFIFYEQLLDKIITQAQETIRRKERERCLNIVLTHKLPSPCPLDYADGFTRCQVMTEEALTNNN